MKDVFTVKGMTCASCASSIEKILAGKTGVESASVNFASNRLHIEYDAETISKEHIQQELRSVGYEMQLTNDDDSQHLDSSGSSTEISYRNAFLGALLCTLPVAVIGMFFMSWEAGKWISLVLTLPVIGWFGRSFYVNAWKQAKHGRTNMDTLVALSTGIAFIFSIFSTIFPNYWSQANLDAHVYYEAASVIITFILLGKWLEEKAKGKTSSAIKKLMGLQPKTLTAIIGGEHKEVPIASAQKGMEILVRAGEKIAVDGQISEGNSYIDEKMITGEPTAVHKSTGAKVFAGTINQQGSFQFIAEKVGSQTVLSQIIALVEQAQGSKAPLQKMADKIASVFVPIVLVISAITFMSWMVLATENAFNFALLQAISVLIIACPCALGLATPTALMVGMGKGAENQILIKDAESLELAHKVSAIVLDKTGTITEGKPRVQQLLWLGQADENISQSMVDHADKSSILLAMEQKSTHPLALAVVQYLKTEGQTAANLAHFESITGKGVKGTINGKMYFVGSEDFVFEHNLLVSSELRSTIYNWQEKASTVIFFADDEKLLAMMAISDAIKEESVAAIQGLKNMGLDVHMLTGDHPKTAGVVANMLGIVHYQAGFLPHEKAAYVSNLRENGKIVAMVGDGINDAHAMAEADVSIAMAHGSDIAIDTAKITLLTSDLRLVAKAIILSKKTVAGIKQNLFWAFIYNLIGIPIAAGVLYPINGFLISPMVAGAAMAFSSVSVVLNSLRLRQLKLNDSAAKEIASLPTDNETDIINQRTLVNRNKPNLTIMNTYKFKTNINCGSCVAAVKPSLNGEEAITNWQVDLADDDRILTVNTEKLSKMDIEALIGKVGFEAKAIE